MIYLKKEDLAGRINLGFYKQVIVVRKDISMSVGKLAVQVAHAAIGSYKLCDKKIIEKWEESGAKKVVVEVDNLEELLKLEEKAKKMGIPNFLVIDAGLTEFPEPTITCLGLGPEEENKINKLTGNLRLLK
ncbi:MAG: peptidyl-tRNA hydrolase Pth2 [Nitrososphaerota archaeon]